MATILIFSENRQIAHKLCDSLIKGNTKQSYAAIKTTCAVLRRRTCR